MQGGQRRPKTLDVDKQKALLFKALVELDAKHLKHELIFWRRPDVVMTQGIIKEG